MLNRFNSLSRSVLKPIFLRKVHISVRRTYTKNVLKFYSNLNKTSTESLLKINIAYSLCKIKINVLNKKFRKDFLTVKIERKETIQTVVN